MAFSASYSAGFNNRVAALAAVFLGLITSVLAWRSWIASPDLPPQDHQPIRRRSLAVALLVCGSFTLGLGWILTKAHVAYNDNLYFLEYMDEISTYHLHLYKDFSFLYGPALLYFPIAIQALLRPFHAGLQISYYVALTLMQLLGIVLLYFTLNALPLSRRLKTITLGFFTFCVLCPLMGLNYTLVRSLLPFSTLLFCTRLKRPYTLAAACFVGEILQLAVSPELGVAFAAGACFYALCCSVSSSRAYLVAFPAPFLAAAAFLGVTGKIYLTSISQFSSGCLNLIIEPLPYILFFLLAMVWMVPRMLGGLAKDRSPLLLPLLSLSVVSVALVPAALGRCDPLHVFFNGAGIYLLAIVAISACSRKAQDLWLFGLLLVLGWTQAVNVSLYFIPIVYAAKTDLVLTTEMRMQDPSMLEVMRLEKIAGKGKISTPLWIPYLVEEELKQNGFYQPDREVFYIGIWNHAAEQARIDRMRETEWAMIPTNFEIAIETGKTSAKVVGMGLDYPDRHAPYAYGQLILNELDQNWTDVQDTPNWVLYRNPRFKPPGTPR